MQEEESFDVIIVGTDLSQCILAGALARAGMKVLHMDKNGYYGGDCATFSLSAIVEWAKDTSSSERPRGDKDDAAVIHSPTNNEIAEKIGVDLGGLIIKDLAPMGENLPVKSCHSRYQVIHHTTLEEEEAYHSKAGITFDLPPYPSSSVSHPAAFGYAMEKKPRWLQSTSPPQSETSVTPVMIGYNTSKKIGPPLTPLETLFSQSRNINLDISPRLMLCQGALVEFLIRSGVGQYLEFKALEACYFLYGDSGGDLREHFKRVPCSKKDIFANAFLPLRDKRVLMKFLQFSMDFYVNENVMDVTWLNEASLQQGRSLKRPQNKAVIEYDFDKYADAPFETFLQHCGLSDMLKQISMYAIALMAKDGMDSREGMSCIGSYVNSLGRYGTTAFLLPLYGVAELSQAFARLCAVYGGIYMLNNRIHKVLVNSSTSKVCGVVDSEGRVLQTKWLVCRGDETLLESVKDHEPDRKQGVVTVVSRAIAIVDKSLFDDSEISFMVIPPHRDGLDNGHAIHILQCNSAINVVPSGHYVIYFSTLASTYVDGETPPLSDESIGEGLAKCIKSLLFDKFTAKEGEDGGKKPVILWQMRYNHHVHTSEVGTKNSSVEHEEWERWFNMGVVTCSVKETFASSDHTHVHFDAAAREAQRLFHRICPDKEFLPKNQTSIDMELREEEEEVSLLTIPEIESGVEKKQHETTEEGGRESEL